MQDYKLDLYHEFLGECFDQVGLNNVYDSIDSNTQREIARLFAESIDMSHEFDYHPSSRGEDSEVTELKAN